MRHDDSDQSQGAPDKLAARQDLGPPRRRLILVAVLTAAFVIGLFGGTRLLPRPTQPGAEPPSTTDRPIVAEKALSAVPGEDLPVPQGTWPRSSTRAADPGAAVPQPSAENDRRPSDQKAADASSPPKSEGTPEKTRKAPSADATAPYTQPTSATKPDSAVPSGPGGAGRPSVAYPPSALDVVGGHASWQVLKRVPSQKHLASLTIDLGDTATRDSVQAIIHWLDTKGIRCTWFVTGWFVENFPDLVAEMYGRGDDLGNHTDTHPWCTKISRQRLIEELTTVEQLLAQHDLAVSSPKYWRPPYGDYNDRVVETAKSLGYRTAMWAATSEDWDLSTNPHSAANRIISRVKPGTIILTHATDVSKEMIPEVVDVLYAEGYQIVPLRVLVSDAGG